MRTTWTRAALIVLCVAFHAPIGRGATTQPAELPPSIDKVVNVPPLDLATKGMSPRDALAAISKQSGVAIYPVARVQNNGVLEANAPPLDFWNSRKFKPLDFDLKGMGFWEAVRRIAVSAGLGIDRGGRDVLINQVFYDRTLAAPGPVSVGPLALFHLPNSSIRPLNNPGNLSGGVSMYLYIDPRIKIWSDPYVGAGSGDSGGDIPGSRMRTIPIHVDFARDELGNEIDARPMRGLQGDCEWKMFIPLELGRASGLKVGNRLAEFCGYVPVSIITKSQAVEIPMQLGASKEAGPWIVKLEDFHPGQSSPSELGIGPIFLGLERRSGADSSVPFPETLYPLVRMLDEHGQALTELRTRSGQPRRTVTGGIREWLNFDWRLESGDASKPAKLVVDLPLEIKQAVIPFDFTAKDFASS